MAEYYHDQWLKARLTEGASQRVQEDTLKFARIMEGLGTGLLDSIMTLIAFTPILWGLSKQIDVLPWIGEVDHQKYFQKNPTQGYCQVVINPKINKFRKEFFQLLKN